MHQSMNAANSPDREGTITLAVITPSYAPDREICEDLNRSVLRFMEAGVTHHIIVPRHDLGLFDTLAGERTPLHAAGSFLPRLMLPIPPANIWLNVRKPYPPIRGWIAQQIVKLSAAASLDVDIALLVDSDIVFIRPVNTRTYAPSGEVVLYRKEDGVDDSLPRHRLWHQVARRLLGLPPAVPGPLPDYICSPCAWQPSVVRAMLEHIEAATGRPWATAVGGELHFSEMVLYGVYVEEVLGLAGRATTSDMLCVNHYDEVPLDRFTLGQLLSSVRAADNAVMISAKSGTSLKDRRQALTEFSNSS